MRSIYEEFVWFHGVVEDRDDPLKLGRCRVRCLGYHTADKSELPTEDLPWAHPLAPITSASMSGVGTTPIGPVEGTWVMGFFRDGSSAQEPVIMGTLPGIPKHTASPDAGFYDPNGKYPLEDYIEEADTNRIARNENIDKTVVQTKKDNLDEMETANGVGEQNTIKEPETPYEAKYPYNKVTESESGHIIEIDDTEGSERLHIYHKSGTFIEVHPDGSMVRKVEGKNHEVFIQDNNVHVKGSMNITVDGDASLYTKGDLTMKTDGDLTHDVSGSFEVNVSGEIRLNAGEGSSSINMNSSQIRENAPTILLN
jgi:hypothetical protein